MSGIHTVTPLPTPHRQGPSINGTVTRPGNTNGNSRHRKGAGGYRYRRPISSRVTGIKTTLMMGVLAGTRKSPLARWGSILVLTGVHHVHAILPLTKN